MIVAGTLEAWSVGWRHRPLVAVISLVGIVLLAALVGVMLGVIDPDSDMFAGRNHVNVWLGSSLLLSGNAMELFRGAEIYSSYVLSVFGVEAGWQYWGYLPHALLVFAPFALMPYLPSALVFLMATLALYGHAVSLQERNFPLFSALLLLPFLLANILAADSGYLTAALMLYGLGLRDRHPVLAGIAIGALTIKPQLGLLLPVLLIFEGNWRTFLAAVVTALVMVALSLALVGVNGWIGYAAFNAPYQIYLMNNLGGFFPNLVPSVFGSMRSLGFAAEAARLFHLPVALAAIAAFIWSLMRFQSPLARSRSLLYATFLISPYTQSHDLGALAALAALAARPEPALPRSLAMLRITLSVLVAFVPLVTLLLGLKGLPLAPLVLLLAYGVTLATDRMIEASSAAPSRVQLA
ncbi:MAG: hypothetical protein DI528_07485 [Shinella sp.]|nr:MAG: hypothetical protein DI528_07485 [Shinella sp.]